MNEGLHVHAQKAQDSERWHPGVHFLLWAVPAGIAILAGLLHGTFFIDDAYITFRYAENLAAGHGLVFNPGETVLGTTTPLFAMVLAGLEMLGLSVPTSAHLLGLFSMAGVVLLLQAFACRSVSLPVAAAMGLCVALHPDTAYMATSGMETAPSLALVLGGLFLSLKGRWAWAGGVGGAALLIRPDGVLVVALAVGLALLRDRKSFWQPLMTSGFVVLPWFLYATVVYGSPLPHSVQAKRMIHPAEVSEILSGYLGVLTEGLSLTVLFALGGLGVLFAMVRRSELLLLALWMLAYIGSLGMSGIAPQFPWYATPLTVTCVLFAAYGADQGVALLLDRVGPARAPSWLRATATSMVLILIAVGGLASVNWASLRTDLENRESAYLEIGQWIAERAETGDVVFVGEVGVLGYLLLDQVVIDSSGINSAEVFAIRRAELAALRENTPEGSISPEGTWRWPKQVIDELKPKYIVTKYPWLHIGKLEDSASFQTQYTRVGPDNPMLLEYRVYEVR